MKNIKHKTRIFDYNSLIILITAYNYYYYFLVPILMVKDINF